MSDPVLKIYYQVDRRRLVTADGAPLAQGYFPSLFFTSAPNVELYLRDASNHPYALPDGEGVIWNADVDIDFNPQTPPLMHVGSSDCTIETGSVAKFRLITATNETKTALGSRRKLEATLLLRAYATETIGAVATDVTKFAVTVPLMIENIINPLGQLPSAIALGQELVDFLTPYFISEESDPDFAAWLLTNPYYTKQQVLSFTEWAASHIKVSNTDLYQEVAYIDGGDGRLYLSKVGDPTLPPWEE